MDKQRERGVASIIKDFYDGRLFKLEDKFVSSFKLAADNVGGSGVKSEKYVLHG